LTPEEHEARRQAVEDDLAQQRINEDQPSLLTNERINTEQMSIEEWEEADKKRKEDEEVKT